jgi:hypothetical protein
LGIIEKSDWLTSCDAPQWLVYSVGYVTQSHAELQIIGLLLCVLSISPFWRVEARDVRL